MSGVKNKGDERTMRKMMEKRKVVAGRRR